MGATVRGEISLVMLAITFVQLVHQFFGGNPLIYFSRKTALLNLLIPAYAWGIVSTLLIVFAVNEFNQLPPHTFYWAMVLALLQSIISTHTTMLLAAELVVKQNLVLMIQSFATLLFLLIAFVYNDKLLLHHYLYALLGAYLLATILSTSFMIRHKWLHLNEYSLGWQLIKGVLSYGIVMQSTNICQFLNYRLSFYLLHAQAGKAALGVFSTAIALGETSWLLSKSLTNVQYPKVVHETNHQFKLLLTNDYAKKAFTGTFCLLLPLLLIPKQGYCLLFGNEFADVKYIVSCLSLGLLLMGFTAPVSHYFSGVSKNRINLYATLTGLIVTVFLGSVLILIFHMQGAILTMLIAYVAIAVVLLFTYCNQTNTSLTVLIPKPSDIKGYINNLFKLSTFK